MKAIITGHTRGLGAALAAELLGRDMPVLALARHRDDALAARFPARLEQVQVDLADSAALASWLAGDALARFAADAEALLLINNAGVLGPIGPLAGQDADGIARAVCVNVTAPLMLSSALARAHSGALRIIHISSGAARAAYSGWSIYCATKAALDHHARAVALDGDANIRVCSLAPGVVDTDMQAEVRGSDAALFPARARFEALKRDGVLVSPQACAAQLVDYALSAAFGSLPVADLRELARD